MLRWDCCDFGGLNMRLDLLCICCMLCWMVSWVVGMLMLV